jgi:hypothetical protein
MVVHLFCAGASTCVEHLKMSKLKTFANAAGLCAWFAAMPALADTFHFQMVPSVGAQTCLPNALARVTVTHANRTDNLNLRLSGLPARTVFDFFVIQVPSAPFGIAWYQGRVWTGDDGTAVADFVGRYSRESFAVAAGSAAAPVVFPDNASSNPAFAPIQTYHLGLWFDDSADAATAGCSNAVTPFNGHHSAGIQVLNTRNYPDDQGPLRHVK